MVSGVVFESACAWAYLSSGSAAGGQRGEGVVTG